MNKWAVSAIIFLILITCVALSIDTSRNKVISITNQAFRIVNSREFLNTDVKTENQEVEIKPQKVDVITKDVENKNKKTKLSNEELIDLKFNELLNKKTKVQSTWEQGGKSVSVVTSTSKVKPTSTKIDVVEPNFKSKGQTVAKLSQQVVSKPVVKNSKIDFSSSNIQNDLKNYITNNVKFPQGYVVSFSFVFNTSGNIAEIHIISIPKNDYYDGDDTYISHVFGDVCKRDNLAASEMYYCNDSSDCDLIPIPINSTSDGPSLKQFYDILAKVGTSHKTQQITYEEQDNYTSVGGMFYDGNLYLNVN